MVLLARLLRARAGGFAVTAAHCNPAIWFSFTIEPTPHVIALDGVYVRGASGRLSFRRVVPHTEDIEQLAVEIAERCEARSDCRGDGPDDQVDPEEDDSQSLRQQASLGGTDAVGGTVAVGEASWRRHVVAPGPDPEPPAARAPHRGRRAATATTSTRGCR